MEEPEQILKTDALGRVKTPKQRRETLLDEFERSGVSASAFAQLCGVNYQTFATWVQQRRRRRKAGRADAIPRLVEVAVGQGRASSATRGLVLHLPDGARMEMVDASQAEIAAALLQALVAGALRC